jgi:hypothetical protein
MSKRLKRTTEMTMERGISGATQKLANQSHPRRGSRLDSTPASAGGSAVQ